MSMYFIHSIYSNAKCGPLKPVVVQKQLQKIKAKTTEIKPDKGQTVTQLFLPHNHNFDKQTDRQAEKYNPRDLSLCKQISATFKL